MSALAFLAQTLRIAIPYLLAAAGGVLSERAGLIGLTLEGYMLGGAFCAAAGSYAAGTLGFGAAAPWLGMLAALLGGAARLGGAHLVVPNGPELDVVAVLVNPELALGAGAHPGLLR